ncbi:MAG: hypothetical protein KTR27_11780 [Leptolyngbyaceae cyanobacterium MAG.088]|nr:hypothetical protein [Leptolyngbyaceae cyanobacterium MAG.088]
MGALSLKTELDVAELLISKGWFPNEINGILVFPLPRAAFHQLNSKNYQSTDDDVIKATCVTPTTLYRARQLLASAGWLDRELNSLLKPCLYSLDPWANQTIKTADQANYQSPITTSYYSPKEIPLPTHHPYRWTMALKRVVSLGVVIACVCMAVAIFG